MDGSNGSNGSDGPGGPVSQQPQQQQQGRDPSRNFAYANNVRMKAEEFTREARAMEQKIQTYLPEAREQVSRILANRPPLPFYARPWGSVVPDHSARLVAVLSLVNGTKLADSQAEAVVDSLRANARTAANIEVLSIAGTAALTYRNLKRRIPAPAIGSRPYLRRFFPIFMFCAYYLPVTLLVAPVFAAASSRYHAAKLRSDPRMQGLRVDTNRIRWSPEGNENGSLENGQQTISERAAPTWSEYTQSSQASQTQQSAAWDQYRQTPSQPQQQSYSSQRPNNGWDSSPLDDDDASPMAQPARDEAKYPGSGGNSAWDRLRQQSGTQQPLQNTSAQQSQDSWGGPSEPRRGYPSGQEGYPSSSSGTDKDSSKDRAQEEFDRLLERERKGVGEERNSWSSR